MAFQNDFMADLDPHYNLNNSIVEEALLFQRKGLALSRKSGAAKRKCAMVRSKPKHN